MYILECLSWHSLSKFFEQLKQIFNISSKFLNVLSRFLNFCLFIRLFLWMPSFEGNRVSLMGFNLTPGSGVDGNAPYQAQELQITTLANPGIQANFLPPRPVLS